MGHKVIFYPDTLFISWQMQGHGQLRCHWPSRHFSAQVRFFHCAKDTPLWADMASLNNLQAVEKRGLRMFSGQVDNPSPHFWSHMLPPLEMKQTTVTTLCCCADRRPSVLHVLHFYNWSIENKIAETINKEGWDKKLFWGDMFFCLWCGLLMERRTFFFFFFLNNVTVCWSHLLLLSRKSSHGSVLGTQTQRIPFQVFSNTDSNALIHTENDVHWATVPSLAWPIPSNSCRPTGSGSHTPITKC